MVGAQKNNYYTIIKLETLKLFKDLKYKIYGFTKDILGLRVKFSEGEFHPTLNSRLFPDLRSHDFNEGGLLCRPFLVV